MVTIDRIPKILNLFFRPLKTHFTEPAWEHFWSLVMAMTISHGTTIERLVSALRQVKGGVSHY